MGMVGHDLHVVSQNDRSKQTAAYHHPHHHPHSHQHQHQHQHQHPHPHPHHQQLRHPQHGMPDEWDVEGQLSQIFERERRASISATNLTNNNPPTTTATTIPTATMDGVTDAQMARTFASAIDDIIKGRKPGHRARGKMLNKMDKHSHLHNYHLKHQRNDKASRSSSSYSSSTTSTTSTTAIATATNTKLAREKHSSSSSSSSPSAAACCEKCGATFASVGNLNRHRRVSHQGLRVYCNFPDCHQSFSQTADLSRHQRRVHVCLYKESR